ncbi:MAG: SAM-dependent methyltransferase [gamma proteobacterium symbiont of Taylorina sp.]|nr:SAM-dependent methyltransferase [gamma proteobacterium symbiont of Taylorina sp.]
MSKQANQNPASDTFPEATPEVIAHSEQLRQKIQESIHNNKGKISFSDYMNQVLYTPGLGYYSAGLKKFGRQGDFVTAPEISPLFSQCLALQCIELMQQTRQRTLLEAGAGSGIMAIEIILELERRKQLPECYLILELSAELRDRQQQAIKAKLPHLFELFHWLDQLPEKPFSGIILANELLDAMPVHLVKLTNDNHYERHVALNKNNEFIWQDELVENPQLIDKLNEIQQLQQSLSSFSFDQGQNKDKPDYITEINCLADDWIRTIADILDVGAILLIDYGYTAKEYYHPQRSMGTLMCHYQHHRHDDPFYLPGMQDITAHVNFSSIAQAAHHAGLKVFGYTTQAHFLMAGGLVELTKDLDPEDIIPFTETARQIKMLTLPEEMGELFKVLLLAKHKTLSLSAFKLQDFRQRL